MSELSVLITTKNRVPLLRRALESVVEQTETAELVIVDDGSTDGTSAFIASEYPNAVLHRNEASVGIIAARNQGVLAASGEFVLTLDDDAVLVNPTTLERVLPLFGDGRVGVVALPVKDIVDGVEKAIRWPDVDADTVICLGSFRAGAATLRRSLFEQLGGYRGIERQGEEADFSLRMMDVGRVVRLAPRDLHIQHFPEHRASSKGHILASAARNRMLSAWACSPSPVLPFESLAVAVSYAWLGLEAGHLRTVLGGIASGLRERRTMGTPREPARFAAYRLHRRLTRQAGLPLPAIEGSLSQLERSFEKRTIRKSIPPA